MTNGKERREGEKQGLYVPGKTKKGEIITVVGRNIRTSREEKRFGGNETERGKAFTRKHTGGKQRGERKECLDGEQGSQRNGSAAEHTS